MRIHEQYLDDLAFDITEAVVVELGSERVMRTCRALLREQGKTKRESN